jgi:transposase
MVLGFEGTGLMVPTAECVIRQRRIVGISPRKLVAATTTAGPDPPPGPGPSRLPLRPWSLERGIDLRHHLSGHRHLDSGIYGPAERMSSCRRRRGGNRYSSAYRREAARLVIDTGRPIACLQGDGIGEQFPGRQVAIERSRSDDPSGALDVDERAETQRLRVEVAELRMDHESLKSPSFRGNPGAKSGSMRR